MAARPRPLAIPGWQPRLWVAAPEASTTSFDIVVVGGGLSGVAAAVASVRRGMRVALLEPTHMLGGQMTVAGVGSVDLVPGYRTTVEHGIWAEIVQRLRDAYEPLGLTMAVARYRLDDSMAANPVITDRVLSELCHAAGVDVFRNCPVEAVDVTTSGGTLRCPLGELTCSVVVEATEDGSVLALAGFPYRAGKQVIEGDRVEGAPSALQRLTQCAIVHRYDDGVPEHLRMTAPPTEYDRFRRSIYGHYPGKPWGITTSDNDFAGYRALPDILERHAYNALDVRDIRRTSLNSSMDLPITSLYLTDVEERRSAQTQALNYALSVIYYLQTECGLQWAVAQDEGYRDGPRTRTFGVTAEMPEWVADLPPLPYLREARRLVGSHTLTAARIARKHRNTSAPWSAQAIAVGTYGTDMHGSKEPGDFETDLGESAEDVLFGHGGPFPIPAGSLVPADDRRLVVAEKNLSMTRVASSAVRVQPSVTAVGEAAGVIATLACRHRTAPRRVPYQAVQISLLRNGALLTPYPIHGAPTDSRDYAAVAMAVLQGEVRADIDDEEHYTRLSARELRAAAEAGGRLVEQWEET